MILLLVVGFLLLLFLWMGWGLYVVFDAVRAMGRPFNDIRDAEPNSTEVDS